MKTEITWRRSGSSGDGAYTLRASRGAFEATIDVAPVVGDDVVVIAKLRCTTPVDGAALPSSYSARSFEAGKGASAIAYHQQRIDALLACAGAG